ncbi:MAG: hypothetical protein EOP84_29230, partial [Verrucomicrobiaceae bacterium]
MKDIHDSGFAGLDWTEDLLEGCIFSPRPQKKSANFRVTGDGLAAPFPINTKLMGNFDAFQSKMAAAGMGDAAIRAFQRNHEALLRDETGMIPESSIRPAEGIPSSEELRATEAGKALLSQAVVIKLNGGLGTGMGLQGPKSLLPIREGVNFIDLMVRQILDLRKTSGSNVRLLLMNSFSTSGDTLAHLERYAANGLADASEVELMQNQIPKIDASTLAPVEWPADPE